MNLSYTVRYYVQINEILMAFKAKHLFFFGKEKTKQQQKKLLNNITPNH